MPWYVDVAQVIPLAICSECSLQLKEQTAVISPLPVPLPALPPLHRPKSPSARWFTSLHIWHTMSNTSTAFLKDWTAEIVALLKVLSIFISGIKNCHCVLVREVSSYFLVMHINSQFGEMHKKGSAWYYCYKKEKKKERNPVKKNRINIAFNYEEKKHNSNLT